MGTFSDFNFNTIYEIIVRYGMKLLGALIVLFIGFKLIKWLINYLNKRFEKSHIDRSLRSFLLPLISITLKVTLFISVIAMLGVEMTSFIALLGTFGLTVGLALQGSFSNFAGGVLILLFKPFTVGDTIEVKGYNGVVKDISIFYTVIATSDNKKVVIPNSAVSNDSLMNYSSYPTRRLELKITCQYKNDPLKVQEVLLNLLKSHELILKEPEPTVRLTAYGDNSMSFSGFGWVKSSDFGIVFNDLMLSIKAEFDKNGITIFYPQIDVNLYDQKTKLL